MRASHHAQFYINIETLFDNQKLQFFVGYDLAMGTVSGSQSVAAINARRDKIRIVMDKMAEKGKPITAHALLAECHKADIKISYGALVRDRIAINKTNTFVENIAESEYSAAMEEIWQSLDYIHAEAIDNYQRTWKQIQTRIRDTPKGKIKEVTETHNQAGPKAMFLQIAKDALDLKLKYMSGDAVKLSVVLLNKKLAEFREQLELAKRERDKALDELKTIKEKAAPHVE